MVISKKKKQVNDIVSHIKREYLKTKLIPQKKSMFHSKYEDMLQLSSPVFNRRKQTVISSTDGRVSPSTTMESSFPLAASTGYKIVTNKNATPTVYSKPYASVSDLKSHKIS